MNIDKVIEAVEKLPDGVEMILYQRSLHPYAKQIMTDELKALASAYKTARECEDRAIFEVVDENGEQIASALNTAAADRDKLERIEKELRTWHAKNPLDMPVDDCEFCKLLDREFPAKERT